MIQIRKIKYKKESNYQSITEFYNFNNYTKLELRIINILLIFTVKFNPQF